MCGEPMKLRAELLLAGLMLASLPGWAEKSDRDKPVNVEADSVRMDDVKKIAVYEGRVVLTQGTLAINADRIEVRQDAQGFASGEARGKPVYFRQKMDNVDVYAEGWADQVVYDARGDKVKLIGQARLKRGEEDLRGNLITYDGTTQFYQAQGSIGGTPGRVKAVILPKNTGPAKP